MRDLGLHPNIEVPDQCANQMPGGFAVIPCMKMKERPCESITVQEEMKGHSFQALVKSEITGRAVDLVGHRGFHEDRQPLPCPLTTRSLQECQELADRTVAVMLMNHIHKYHEGMSAQSPASRSGEFTQ